MRMNTITKIRVNSCIPTTGRTDKKSLKNLLFNSSTCRFSRLELDEIAREEIGRKAKRIIDLGRVKYLAEVCGMSSQLKSYVLRTVSLENVMLLSSGQTGSIG